MIMQEYEPKRRNVKIPTKSTFDELPINTSSLSNNSTMTNDEVPILQAKRQTPFPYLRRKSIRIDLILKKQKLAQKKKLLETLRNDKKNLQSENLLLKGRLMQMEFILKQLNISKTQTKSTQPKKEKYTMVQCSKCNKCLSSKYIKYHDRICGNTRLDRLLSESDLKRLQFIRKNQKLSISMNGKPKNNWKQQRQDFLNQIKSAKSKNLNCIIYCKPNCRKC